MLKKIQERIFPFLIAISALSVSASAAFYSVSGLSKLFAGAAFAVIIMAASLEVAKLIIASLLYQYRKTLPRGLKIYLTTAAFVLVLITSMGIYGFLSAAYQETANKAGNIDAQIALIETKRDNVRDQLTVYNAEKSTINEAVADLQAGLANNVIQYKDRETGEIITTTSSSTRRALERQLDQAIERQTELNTKIDGLNTQLFDYETEIVEIQTSNDLAGELGPLKYLSGLTGIPMDKIINYLLLTIIFVFDPLAIALVIAANFAFEQIGKKYKKNLYGEKVIKEEDNVWGSTLNDGLEDEEWDEEEEPNEALKQAAEVYKSKKKVHEKLKDSSENLEIPSESIGREYKSGLKNEYDEFDLNKDGILDENELIAKENALLKDSSISAWRKNLILKKRKNKGDDLTKTY